MDLIMFLTFMINGCLYAFRGEVMFALGCFFISAVFWLAYKVGYAVEKAVTIKAAKELVEKFGESLANKEEKE